MRIIITTLSLTIISITTGFGQIENTASKIVSARFENYYNKGDYDVIFMMLSKEMQVAFPQDKNNDFLTKLKSGSGQIIKRNFVDHIGTSSVYKTEFERGRWMIHLSVNDQYEITGYRVKPYTEENLSIIERNTTRIKLPFKDEWTVIWGGDTKELNYHVESQGQKNAFDLTITDAKNRSYRGNGQKNEDYYAFGKEIYAPCDGEIVLVVNGVKDNLIGHTNAFNVGGNMIILKTAKKEYLVFCHFKHQSIAVKEGQIVAQGDLLGLCGNSGHSSEPHLHFHIQNTEEMATATGVKCYFDQLIVNGEPQNDYSPIKGERIKNQ